MEDLSQITHFLTEYQSFLNRIEQEAVDQFKVDFASLSQSYHRVEEEITREVVEQFKVDFAGLSQSYHELEEEITHEVVEQFKVDFAELSQSHRELEKDIATISLAEAPKYNIFTILPRTHWEDTHTRFLQNLLDPNGSHGQAGLFLTSFIHRFIPKERQADFACTNDCLVKSEHRFNDGRLDLYISNPYAAPQADKNFGIVIENKIYTNDGPKQLKKYHDFLDKKHGAKIMLFYLTLDGRAPSEYSMCRELQDKLTVEGVLCNLSYRQDIHNWLHACQAEVKPAKVCYLLCQYLTTINSL